MTTRRAGGVDHEVLVVGAGPTGLLLGALLAGHGVDVAVLERRSRPSTRSRAIGLHPPGVAALAQVGVREAVLEAGARVHTGEARSRGRLLGRVTFERAWPRTPFVLTLPQQRTEAVLEGRLAQLAPGVLHRGREVVAVDDADPGPVRVRVRPTAPSGGGEETWTARVVVVAGGAHGATREVTGAPGPVRTYPDTYLTGDFAGTGTGTSTSTGSGTATVHLDPGGVVESFPLPGGVRRWVAHTGCSPVRGPEPEQAQRLAEIVRRRTGEVLDPGSSSTPSAVTVHRRTVARVVRGRRVVLGDAAHEISPIGGQGMTLGRLDACDLAPLLVQELRGGRDRDLADVPGLLAFQRRRLSAARRAAWQAAATTRLGRPVPAAVRGPRDVLLRAVLATPARHALAGAFSMRWADVPDDRRHPQLP